MQDRLYHAQDHAPGPKPGFPFQVIDVQPQSHAPIPPAPTSALPQSQSQTTPVVQQTPAISQPVAVSAGGSTISNPYARGAGIPSTGGLSGVSATGAVYPPGGVTKPSVAAVPTGNLPQPIMQPLAGGLGGGGGGGGGAMVSQVGDQPPPGVPNPTPPLGSGFNPTPQPPPPVPPTATIMAAAVAGGGGGGGRDEGGSWNDPPPLRAKKVRLEYLESTSICFTVVITFCNCLQASHCCNKTSDITATIIIRSLNHHVLQVT